MPRKVTWGTPGRTEHYLEPRRKWRFLYPAAGLGALLFAGLMGLHVIGYRNPVSPGGVSSPHAPIEARCQECHTTREGASDIRCQRCHDPGGAGRLTNNAHILFGSRDLKKAAAADHVQCARCHVEHRGRTTALGRVDETHCIACHTREGGTLDFRSFGKHPEFAALRSPSVEVPGLTFSHDEHMKAMMKERGLAPAKSCGQCHQTSSTTRDFEPLSFDQHCASCHGKDGQLAVPVDPVPAEDVLSVEAVLALGVRGRALRAEEFETSRGKIGKPVVRHRDEWVLFNIAKLGRELDPAAFTAERGGLLARQSQLERRLALATPLAGIDRAGLTARAAAIQTELTGIERRLQAQAGGLDPAAGLDRVEEVLRAAGNLRESGVLAEAQALQQKAGTLRGLPAPAAALPSPEHEVRRTELLTLLESVQTADPRLKGRAEDLRRRLLSLTPGDSGADLLQRVREQRQADLKRVQDELLLREGGIASPPEMLLEAERRALRKSQAEVAARLAELAQVPAPAGELTEEERARKSESLEILAAACTKCHVLAKASLSKVVAARPVLSRGRFLHEPHLLQAECVRCHPTVEKSKLSQDLNFTGVQSCRECHRSWGVKQDCQECHHYHPPAAP